MTITGPEATIFGCIVAAVVALYLRHRNAFGAASKEFISAFAPEIAVLQSPSRTKTVRDILIEAFQRHNEAATIFKRNLNDFSKSRFDQVWKQYHNGHCFDAEGFGIDPEEQLFMDYFSFDSQSDAATHALKQIHNLLQFAKQP